MATSNPYRMVASLQYWLVAVITVMLGLGLFYLSGTKWGKDHTSVSSLANQLGGLLIASIALATIWDLFGRRAQFKEFLDVVKLKDDVVGSGLEYVGLDYNKAIDWESSLATAKELDIFVAWAASWRNTHQSKLTDMATRNGSVIRVFIPDLTNSFGVSVLADRFNRTEQEVCTKLTETIEDYKRLDGGSRSGRVEIYATPVYRAFSAYRIDDVFVVTLYHHKDSRSGLVPVFVFHKGGPLFEYFKDDLEGVLSGNTRRIYP